MRELQALVAPKPPQGVLVRGHAGLVINKFSQSALSRFVAGAVDKTCQPLLIELTITLTTEWLTGN